MWLDRNESVDFSGSTSGASRRSEHVQTGQRKFARAFFLEGKDSLGKRLFGMALVVNPPTRS